MKQVVVLGGGFAGITICNKLARKAKRHGFAITLIEPKEYNLYEPEMVYGVFPNKRMKNIKKPIAKLLNKKVKWIKEKATKLNLETNSIELEDGEVLEYDYLVLATGARLETDKIGYGNGVYHFYDYEATLELKKALEEFKEGTIVISPSTVPYKCPPAPLEFAFLLDVVYLRKKKLRDKVTIKYLYPLSRAFTMREVAVVAEKLLKKRGIEFVSFFNFEAIDHENKKVLSLEGEEISYDMLVLIPPHEGQQIIKDAGIGDRDGWVKTDKFSLKVHGFDNIYAIGDCTDMPVSKAGAVIHFAAPTLVKNLLAQIKGKEPKAKYNGLTTCFLMTSFNKSMFLHFSYNYPPKKYGLHSNFIFGLFKKVFKWLYFNILIKGIM